MTKIIHYRTINTLYLLILKVLLLTPLPLMAEETGERRTLQMLESILKSAPTGIGVVENRVIVQVNDYILDLTGYMREELIGQNARMLYPTLEESDYVGKEKYRQIAEKGTGSVETRWLRKDSTIRHVILSSTPLDPSDISTGVTFTVLDITERKQSEERFAKAFDSSPAALMVSEIVTGRFINVNDSWVKMLGYTSEELIGRTSREVGIWSDPDDRDHIITKLHAQGLLKDEPIRFVTKSGEYRFALWSAEVITLDGRDVLLSLLLDETNRRYAERALKMRTTWFMVGAGVLCLALLFLLLRLAASLNSQKAIAEDLESFFSVNLDLLCIADLEGNFIKTNKAWSTILGYSVEELVKMKFLEFVHPDDIQATLDAMADLGKGDDILGFTNRYRCKDGSYRYIEWRAHPRGKVIYAAARDITERKRLEEALKESEKRLDLAMEVKNEGIWDWNLVNNETFFDDRYYTMAGYAPNEFPQNFSAWADRVHTGDLVHCNSAIKACISGQLKDYDVEFRFKHKDGSWIWIQGRGRIVERDEKGESLRMIGTHADITDRKRAEQAQDILYNIALQINLEISIKDLIEFARQELGKILDTANLFVASYNPDNDTLRQLYFKDEQDNFDDWPASKSISGKVVKSGKTIFLKGEEIENFCNKHNLELLGTKSLCWLGVPVIIQKKIYGVLVIQHYSNTNAFNSSDAVLLEMIAHEIGIYIEKNKMIEEIVLARDQAEQSERALQKMYYELQVSEEETRAVNEELSTTSDALKENNVLLLLAKKKAEESDRLKTAFLQNMSHEIRTPMNAIQGFSELLTKPNITDEELKGYVNIIQKSSDQLLTIVSDILTISSIDTGQEKINNTKVCISNLISETEAIFNQQITGKPVTVKGVKPAPGVETEIATDSTKLNQILSNLLTNAIKYTSAGEILVGYTIKDSLLEFYVKDSGIGVDKSKHRQIFERFVQADDNIRYEYGGTGLGLSICKGYIELLGGRIWVESELGKGATFFFTIPYRPIKDNKNFVADITEPSNQLKNLTILIAEDDEYSFMLINELLTDYNCQIIHAANGKEAVDICKDNESISFVIMDIKMPVMDGITATKLIKDFRPDLPVIAHSAYATEQYIENTRDIFTAYVTKPINSVNLKYILSGYGIPPAVNRSV